MNACLLPSPSMGESRRLRDRGTSATCIIPHRGEEKSKTVLNA
jgi:hypothetical protein